MKKTFKAIEIQHLDNSIRKKIREWRNQPFVSEMMYTKHLITVEEHEAFVEKLIKDVNRGLYVFFLDDVPFGVFQYQIHPEGNYVTSGNYLIAQQFQDLGYGIIQLFFQNEIIFYSLNCNKSFGEVLEHNKKARSTNKKTGGKIEGVLRQQIIVDGHYEDVYCFGLLKNEWEKHRNKIGDIVYEFIDKDSIEIRS